MSARNSSAGVYPDIIKKTVKENNCPSIKLVLLQFLQRTDKGDARALVRALRNFCILDLTAYGFGNIMRVISLL